MTERSRTSESEADLTLDDAEPPAGLDPETRTALTGFFTGLILVAVVPTGYVAAMGSAFGAETADKAFPFVMAFLVIPLGLMAFRATRRFGLFFLLGVVVTLIVVGGVGIGVLWLLLRYSR
jgi:hypothetical protein